MLGLRFRFAGFALAAAALNSGSAWQNRRLFPPNFGEFVPFRRSDSYNIKHKKDGCLVDFGLRLG
jgi:hypothetical protein